MNVLVVELDGTIRDEVIDGDNVLQELYRLIGCRYVDVVSLAHPHIDMWVDEEGLLAAEPLVNMHATYIARHFGFTHQLYVGVAVFTGGSDRWGNTLGLDPATATFLRKLLHP